MNAMMRFQNHKIAMRLFVIPLCFLMAFSAMTSGTREAHAVHPAVVFLGKTALESVAVAGVEYLVGEAAGAIKTLLNKDNVKPTRVGGGGSTRGGGAGRRYNWSESEYGQALANGSSSDNSFNGSSGLSYVGQFNDYYIYLVNIASDVAPCEDSASADYTFLSSSL